MMPLPVEAYGLGATQCGLSVVGGSAAPLSNLIFSVFFQVAQVGMSRARLAISQD